MGNNPMALIALAAGAYLLFKNGFFDSFLGGATTPTTPANGGTTPIVGGTNTSVAFDIKSAMQSKMTQMQVGPMLNWDQWNFVYKEVRGVDGPSFESVPDVYSRGRDYQMTLDEYLSHAKPLGLSGMMYSTKYPSSYVMRGKGDLMLANNSPMYTNSPFAYSDEP